MSASKARKENTVNLPSHYQYPPQKKQQYDQIIISRRRCQPELYHSQGGLEDMIGGYEVIIACNGKEGLEKYRQVKPDIIVADIEMPVMDGYEMVRRIRETDRELPILFSSARVSPKDVVKGYELGSGQLRQKPFLPEELDAHVRALLRMKQGNTEKVKKPDMDNRRIHIGSGTGDLAPYLRKQSITDTSRERDTGTIIS